MSGAAELAAELLAHPREAGTPEAARVRTLVSHRLRALGYVVEEQPFVFSPASLYAFPVLGAGLGWLALVLLPLLAAPAPPRWAAIAVWMAGLLALGMIVCGLGVGWAPPGSPARQDANLIATRGPGVVRRWIVAHADTKAQGHSMAGRLVAVWIVTLAVAVETALAVARLGGPVPIAWVAAGAGLLVAAGFLAGRGRLRGGSRGARDNGSGL
ncbi:MAG TPA: hypothetical protein VNK43_06370, partial [Gemmatimonadales bacterium]|nr:hypothetical protein [Gemmatimonadales bacterium]